MPEASVPRPTSVVGEHAQRIARAVRDQVALVPQSLEERVASDHPARAIWAVLERLELGPLYARIRAAVDGSDPRVLLGLWLLATAEGIGTHRGCAAGRGARRVSVAA